MSTDKPQLVELMEEYEKLGLTTKPRAPPDGPEHDGNARFKPPELARILELPRKSGYGVRRIKLDSFDEQIDLNEVDDEEFSSYSGRWSRHQ